MGGIDELQGKLQRFESFVQIDPDNADLLIELGDLYHQTGRFDAALGCFERALVVAPGWAVPRARGAAVWLSQRRFAEAASALGDLLAGPERDPALLHNFGLALFHLDRFEQAAACFAEAADLQLHHPDNWKYLAYSAHRLGRLDQAVAACEQWLALGREPAAGGYLALLLFDRGDKQPARALAQKVLAQQPDNADAAAVLGSLAIEEQDLATAGACFEGILARQPEYGRAALGMGLLQLHQQRYEAALASLSRAVAQMPGHAGTMVALGWAKLIAQDAAGAAAVFRQAQEIDRNFAEAHGGLAAALAQLGQDEAARHAITLADKLDSANFGAVYAKAMLLRADGRARLADRLMEQALRQAPAPGAKPMLTYLNGLLSPAAPPSAR